MNEVKNEISPLVENFINIMAIANVLVNKNIVTKEELENEVKNISSVLTDHFEKMLQESRVKDA